MQKRWIAFVLFLIATVFFGMAYVFIREGVLITHPYNFLFFRFLLATACLSLLFPRSLVHLKSDTIKYGVLLGIPFAASLGFLTVGLHTTTAAHAGFIGGLYIVFVPLIIALLHKKAPSWQNLTAIAIALIGLGIISLRADFSIAIGDVFVLLWSLLFALYIVLVGKYAPAHDTVQITLVQFSVTLIVAGILATLTQHFELPKGYTVWRSLMFVALLATVFTYLIQNRFQRYLSDISVGLIYSLEPLFAAVTALFMLHEQITPRLMIGGAIIFCALVFSELPLKKSSAIAS